MHALAQDDEVAAEVSGDLLRRPAVESRFTSQDKVRVVEVGQAGVRSVAPWRTVGSIRL
ncbi:DUF6192 family protein [Streptomyces sp. NPDC056486]|uniref:DUF6192 family protein n=1 Tax=Streptomyces sp. NPDC056486 TaxID=3345835 RepID=UPI0036B3EA4C